MCNDGSSKSYRNGKMAMKFYKWFCVENIRKDKQYVSTN